MKLSRISIRVEEDIKRDVLSYCEREHVTLSELITRYLVQLLAEERERRLPIDAEQI